VFLGIDQIGRRERLRSITGVSGEEPDIRASPIRPTTMSTRNCCARTAGKMTTLNCPLFRIAKGEGRAGLQSLVPGPTARSSASQKRSHLTMSEIRLSPAREGCSPLNARTIGARHG
jgi:hypothetical protein